MNPNITAEVTCRNMQLFIPEEMAGWGNPYKAAIITGKRKAAAPHSSCELGNMPRGWWGCWFPGRSEPCRHKGCKAPLLAVGMGTNTLGTSFATSIPLFRGLWSNLPSASVSSASSPLEWLRMNCAVPHLVHISDLQEFAKC